MKKRLLIDSSEISLAVQNLAIDIKKHYEGKTKPVAVVSVLKGAAFFTTDLLKHLYPLPLTLDFISASSYKGKESTGQVDVQTFYVTRTVPKEEPKDILLIEDILDTGLTLTEILNDLNDLAYSKPASLNVCSLLAKETFKWPSNFDGKKFVGITVPDKFLVGYGLDIDQAERHSPDIYVLED